MANDLQQIFWSLCKGTGIQTPSYCGSIRVFLALNDIDRLPFPLRDVNASWISEKDKNIALDQQCGDEWVQNNCDETGCPPRNTTCVLLLQISNDAVISLRSRVFYAVNRDLGRLQLILAACQGNDVCSAFISSRIADLQQLSSTVLPQSPAVFGFDQSILSRLRRRVCGATSLPCLNELVDPVLAAVAPEELNRTLLLSVNALRDPIPNATAWSLAVNLSAAAPQTCDSFIFFAEGGAYCRSFLQQRFGLLK